MHYSKDYGISLFIVSSFIGAITYEERDFCRNPKPSAGRDKIDKTLIRLGLDKRALHFIMCRCNLVVVSSPNRVDPPYIDVR